MRDEPKIHHPHLSTLKSLLVSKTDLLIKKVVSRQHSLPKLLNASKHEAFLEETNE